MTLTQVNWTKWIASSVMDWQILTNRIGLTKLEDLIFTDWLGEVNHLTWTQGTGLTDRTNWTGPSKLNWVWNALNHVKWTYWIGLSYWIYWIGPQKQTGLTELPLTKQNKRIGLGELEKLNWTNWIGPSELDSMNWTDYHVVSRQEFL